MPLELQFRSIRTTGALHAALILAEGGKLAHPQLHAALLPHAKTLHREMRHIGLTRSALHPTARGSYRFADDLLALSATHLRPRELIRTALIKAVGADHREEWEAPFAVCLRKIEQAFDEVVGETDEQLALRGLPLRQAWQTRGLGLTRGLLRWADPQLLVDEAHVTLVYPAVGGGGRAHSRYNALTLEALLADPLPELPELLRLVWLASLLNLDLPKFQAHFSAARIVELTELAMLPITLAAAEDVEFAACNQATVDRALQHWQFSVPPGKLHGERLWNWWLTFRDARPAWNIAIAALDRLLSDANSA